jgi:DNA-binding response OmpR family regulator
MALATILIIDDSVNLARGFAAGLTHAGYDVHVAHTADQGLALAREVQPRAIILDFQMPFVNGVGFLYRLRELSALRDTPVMVVTGVCVSDETLHELRELRAELRFKPLSLRELLEETHTLLQPVVTPRSPSPRADTTGGAQGPPNEITAFRS